MAHFAELNENNIVQRVIVVHNNELLDENGNESEQKGINFCVAHYGSTWIQTSYNANIRGQYAGTGMFYNEEEDIFIAPQPYPSWIRNGSFWEAPTPMPTDDKQYTWDETTTNWVEVTV
jgi:hypothetical protein